MSIERLDPNIVYLLLSELSVLERYRLAEKVAQTCHEANRAFCEYLGEDVIAPRWDNANQELKDSAISGVIDLLDNPLMTSEDSHINWMEFKKGEGWVYGPVKDFALKTHPCLVPYAELPYPQYFVFHFIIQKASNSRLPFFSFQNSGNKCK